MSLRKNARELRKRMTPAEVRLWQAIRGNQLGVRFRRQVPMGRYVVDFAATGPRIVVELDGSGHHEPSDAVRDSWLRSRGFRVVRVENVIVWEALEPLLEVLGRMIRDTAWEPEPYWWT